MVNNKLILTLYEHSSFGITKYQCLTPKCGFTFKCRCMCFLTVFRIAFLKSLHALLTSKKVNFSKINRNAVSAWIIWRGNPSLPINLTKGGDVVDKSVWNRKIQWEVWADHGRERQVGRADVGDRRLVLPVRRFVRTVQDAPVWSRRNG